MGKVEILAKKQKAYFLGINCGRLKSAKKAHAKISRAISPKTMQLANTPPQKSITNF